MSDRACETCRYGKPNGPPTIPDRKIICKHGPPMAHERFTGYFPIMPPDEWCWRWQRKLTQEEADQEARDRDGE